jgi:hypothetical protein
MNESVLRPAALVVYESMFGNTRDVASAVADGLSSRMDVTTLEVGDAPLFLGDVALLVVGGPTHAFGMSRPRTRDAAAGRNAVPVVSTRGGLREWVHALATPAAGIYVSAFDTKIRRPPVPGSAARGAMRRLRHIGFNELGPTRSFYVADTEGPLLDGELARARDWGCGLGEFVAGRTATVDRRVG